MKLTNLKATTIIVAVAMIAFVSIATTVKAQPRCPDLMQEIGFCSNDDFTLWGQPTPVWITLDNRCPVYVLYRSRMCRSNYDHVELYIIGAVFNYGYRYRRCPIPIICPWIYPCRETDDFLLTGEPNIVREKNENFEYELFRRVARHITQLPGGPRPLCNPPQGDPNGPIKFVHRKTSSCRGWCVTHNPHPIVVYPEYDNYRWDITTLPSVAMLNFLHQDDDEVPSDGEIELLDDEGLRELDSFFKTEIIPNISATVVKSYDESSNPSSTPFAPITSIAATRILWQSKNCTENGCCLQVTTLCVQPNGSIHQTEEVFTNTVPCIDLWPVKETCRPGDRVNVVKCKSVCQ